MVKIGVEASFAWGFYFEFFSRCILQMKSKLQNKLKHLIRLKHENHAPRKKKLIDSRRI